MRLQHVYRRLSGWPLAMLVVLSCLLLPRYASAQCAQVAPEYMIAGGGSCKCHFPENSCSVSSPPKFYLTSTTTGSLVLNYEDYYDDGTVADTVHAEQDPHVIIAYTRPYCTATTNDTSYAEYDYYDGSVPYSVSGTDDADYGAALALGDTLWRVCQDAILYSCPDGLTDSGDCSSTTVSTNETGSCSGTDESGVAYTASITGSPFSTTSLSSEYTDQNLNGDIRQYFLSLYPGYFTNGIGVASYAFDDGTHQCAGGSKMKYHFHVTNCQAHESYKVTWDQITTYPDGSGTPQAPVHMREVVSGNGDTVNGVYTSTREIDMPSSPCTISIANWQVTEVDSGGGGGPGNGGPQ